MRKAAIAFLAPAPLPARSGTSARPRGRGACARQTPRADFARSAALVDGLNADHVRELAALAVSYGTVTHDLSALQSVRATALTRAGIALEAVMCDEGGSCVCALETLAWPAGAVASAEEALSALRVMVDNAGLDGDVLRQL